MSLEIIPWNLLAYKYAVPSTISCVDDLNKERTIRPELRNIKFYTGDGIIYFLRGKSKTPVLMITREAYNPILNNIDDAVDQLIRTGHYKVKQTDFEAAKNASDTVFFDLTKLEWIEYKYMPCAEWSVDTSKKLSEYNREIQNVLKRVCGSTLDEYYKFMKTLEKLGIEKTTIHFCKPDDVKEYAKNEPISTPFLLCEFSNNPSFYVGEWGRNKSVCVHGELRDIEDNIKKIIKINPAGLHPKILQHMLRIAYFYPINGC